MSVMAVRPGDAGGDEGSDAPPQAVALLAFGDEAKPGARQAIETLHRQGIRAVMISGDNRSAAEGMARRLGLKPEAGEVLADVLPGGKAEAIARKAC